MVGLGGLDGRPWPMSFAQTPVEARRGPLHSQRPDYRPEPSASILEALSAAYGQNPATSGPEVGGLSPPR